MNLPVVVFTIFLVAGLASFVVGALLAIISIVRIAAGGGLYRGYAPAFIALFLSTGGGITGIFLTLFLYSLAAPDDQNGTRGGESLTPKSDRAIIIIDIPAGGWPELRVEEHRSLLDAMRDPLAAEIEQANEDINNPGVTLRNSRIDTSADGMHIICKCDAQGANSKAVTEWSGRVAKSMRERVRAGLKDHYNSDWLESVITHVQVSMR
ncbi:MAG: hypothetical protein HY286_08590 [Planctomycetes bacterium]|nr:hypothetical protein [Planctomycetota bacterium]